MRRMGTAVVIVCFSCSSVAAGQSKSATETPPPSVRYLTEWSTCQRDFLTPLLKSSEPIPSVIEKAHAHCLSLEQTLKEALNTEHGPKKGSGIFASISEATDLIMCGLLTSVRTPGDSKISFDTAAECLAGHIKTTR